MQQINFHRDTSVKQQPLGALRLAQYTALVFVLLCADALWVQYQLSDRAQAQKRLQGQHDLLTQTRDQLRAAAEQLQPDARLQKQIRELELELGDKQILMSHLEQIRGAQSNGFSYLLDGFSEQHLKGVWLERIDLASGGLSFSLFGQTYKPELIPRYIAQLQQAKVFSGKSFDIFSLKRDEEHPARLAFSLQSGAELEP